MLMAGAANGSRDSSCAQHKLMALSAWQRFWHVTFPASARGVRRSTILLLAVRELQLLHHPLDHDRRRPFQRLPHLDHAHLRARSSDASAGERRAAYSVLLFIILMALGRYLRARALSQVDGRRTRGMTHGERHPDACAAEGIDGWRWGGRIFLCSCCSTPQYQWPG